MKAKKILHQFFVLSLSAFVVLSLYSPYLQVFAQEVKAKSGAYFVDFSDGDAHGWKKLSGGGNVSFSTDGMNIQHSGNATFVSADDLPQQKDGYVETVFQTKNEQWGRIGFQQRFVDKGDGTPLHAAAFNYDIENEKTWRWGAWNNGNETWAGNELTNLDNTRLSANQDYKLRIELRDRHVVSYLTNLSTNVTIKSVDTQGPMDWPLNAGKFAIRAWGGTGGEGHLLVKSIKIGATTNVEVTPSTKEIAYANAGSQDEVFTLSTEDNPLTKIIVGGNELRKDIDYTMDGTTLTIKKSYIQTIKEDALTSLVLQFDDEFTTNITIKIAGIPEQEEAYTRNFLDAKNVEGINHLAGTSTLTDGKLVTSSSAKLIDNDAPSILNGDVSVTMTPLNDNGGDFGIYLRYIDETNYIYVGTNGNNNEHGTKWHIKTPRGTQTLVDGYASRVFAKRVPITIRANITGSILTLYADGIELAQSDIAGILPNNTAKGKPGVKVDNRGASIDTIYTATTIGMNVEELANPDNQELRSESMQVVLDKKFPRIVRYTLDGTNVDGQHIPYYVVEVNNQRYVPEVTSSVSGNKMVYNVHANDYTFDVVYTINANVVTMSFEHVDDTIYSINFPQHSLVSMDDTQEDATLTYQSYRDTNNRTSQLAKRSASGAYETTSIAVLHNRDVAATLFHDSLKGNREIAIQTQSIVGGGLTTGLWANEFQFKSRLDNKPLIENPSIKIALTKDCNQDGVVDYQDGAVAYRDIAPEVVGAQLMRNSYSTIAMNVGSGAQYPFLRILDNIKKVNLGTDGFHQTVLMKGYQAEGHDSAHPDFANINKGAGGIEDYQTLLRESKNYNASIGVHINHTETYPEAPQYETLKSGVQGWRWYDSAMQLVRENDILDPSENGMNKRLEKLAEISQGNLDMVYVDVFMDRDFPAWRLMSKLNELGWAVGGEDQGFFPRQMAWVHNPVGGSSVRGYGDTSLIRFVDHQDKEQFVNSNIFRGQNDNTRVIGINGWQAGADASSGGKGLSYDNTISHFYDSVLPNKYLMQFPLMKMEGNKATLGANSEVTAEYTGGKNIIKKDGKVVADGNDIFIPWGEVVTKSITEEKIYAYSQAGGVKTWDLPNSWRDVTTIKLYPLSDEGRGEAVDIAVKNHQVSLDLDAKKGYVVYKATTKPSVSPDASFEAMDWSTGSPVKDMGFDSHSFEAWTPKSSAKDTSHVSFVDDAIKFSDGTSKGNTVLKIDAGNDGSVSQTMQGLVVGQAYSASVWVDVPNDRRGTLTITNGDEVLDNYTEARVGKQGLSHSDKLDTYYQRMKIEFIAKETSATIALSAASGQQGPIYFDDVRVMKTAKSDTKGHTYYEDFENVDQGYGIFESYYADGTSALKFDNSHLAQRNPRTPLSTPDVLAGEYSLKLAGDPGSQNGKSLIRTLPDRVRFEPNTKYTVGFNFKHWKSNAPVYLSIKSNATKESIVTQTITGDGEKEFTFTTKNAHDYYIELVNNGGQDIGYVIDDFYVDLIDEQSPSQPTNIEVSNIQTTKALVNWRASSDNVGVVKYEIRDGESVLKTIQDGTSAELTDLQPNTTYRFELLAYDASGNVSEAGVIQFKTLALPLIDSIALDKAIEAANSLKKSEGYADVSQSLKQALEASLVKAADVKADEMAVQGAYDEAADAIHKAIANIEQAIVKDQAKKALQAQLAAAEALDETSYTKNSYDELKNVIVSTHTLLANDSATKEAYIRAKEELIRAIQALVVRGNTSALVEAIQQGNTLKESDYTTSSFEKFERVLQGCKALIDNPNATQADVDTALEQLKIAISKLEVKEPEQPVDSITIKSDDERIQISGPFEEGVSAHIREVKESTFKDDFIAKNKTFFELAKLEQLFDITLQKDGKHYAINHSATIKIQIPAHLKGANLGIIYIDDVGAIQIMKSKVEDGYLVFDTTHFSHYAIVSYNANVEKPVEPSTPLDPSIPTQPDTPADPIKPNSPDTSDTTRKSMYGAVLILALGCIAIVTKKEIKKRKN